MLMLTALTKKDFPWYLQFLPCNDVRRTTLGVKTVPYVKAACYFEVVEVGASPSAESC